MPLYTPSNKAKPSGFPVNDAHYLVVAEKYVKATQIAVSED